MNMNIRITLPFVLVWVAFWNRMWVIGLFLQMPAVCVTVWKQKTDLHFNICYVSAAIISLLLKVKGLFKTTTKQLCNILKLGFGCCIPQRVNVLHFLLWFVVWKISTSFLLQKEKARLCLTSCHFGQLIIEDCTFAQNLKNAEAILFVLFISIVLSLQSR